MVPGNIVRSTNQFFICSIFFFYYAISLNKFIDSSILKKKKKTSYLKPSSPIPIKYMGYAQLFTTRCLGLPVQIPDMEPSKNKRTCPKEFSPFPFFCCLCSLKVVDFLRDRHLKVRQCSTNVLNEENARRSFSQRGHNTILKALATALHASCLVLQASVPSWKVRNSLCFIFFISMCSINKWK